MTVDLAQHQDAIFDQAPFGLGLLGPQGHFLRTNAALHSLLGRSGAELAELRFAELTHPEEAAADSEAFQSMLLGQSRLFQREKRYRHADGRYLWVWVTALALLDPESRVFGGSLTYVIDINSRKEAELALRQKVETEARLRAQEALLDELSTPLIPITDKVMVMPLIGRIEPARAERILHTLLDGIAQARAHTAIIDITGVRQVDAGVADMLMKAARAVRLLGAQVILTGIRAEMALTLVSLSADMSGLVTRGTLQSGIAYALGNAVSAH